MRIFKMTYKDKSGIAKKTRKWAIEFTNHKDSIKRLSGFSDKAQTAELGRKIERLVALKINGQTIDKSTKKWFETLPTRISKKLESLELLDSSKLTNTKLLIEHIKEFENSLITKGTTEKQVKLVLGRLRRVVKSCQFLRWSDITSLKVQGYLHSLTTGEKKLSAQTTNFYLQSIKQFCNWMVREGKAETSPVLNLKSLNVRVDRRHDRRALTPEESLYLLKATKIGPVRKGLKWQITGVERSLLYQLALETGLRAGELRSLTPKSFNLKSTPATIKVKAAYSKRRREDILPLREDTTHLISKFIEGIPNDQGLFSLPRQEAFIKRIYKPDLDFARKQWIKEAEQNSKELKLRQESEFLLYKNHEGLYADFHALRHSFITNITRATGTHFKTAQELARHSSPLLTARYAHSFDHEKLEAIDKLPSSKATEKGRLISLKNSADNSAEFSAEECNSVQLSAAKTTIQQDDGTINKLGVSEDLGKKTGKNKDEMVGGGTRIRTGDDGFANRCLSHLAMPPL